MVKLNLTNWFQFSRRFLVGWVLIYFAVVLTVGGTPIARWLLYGVSLCWLALLVLIQFKFKNPIRSVRWLDVIATNVAVTLVVAEISLQCYSSVAGSSLLVRANLDAHRLSPGHDYGAGLVGNRLGYPGPELPPVKKPGFLRIAALGDSFAVAPAVPFADCYLTRLTEELPHVEVGNFGVSGAGPREYLDILQRDVWPLQPDLVLLSIFVGNDITESLPRPRSLDPRHHALYLLIERGWKLARAAQPTEEQPNHSFPQRLTVPPLSAQLFREVEARRLEICLTKDWPSMEKKWRRAFADLDSNVQACRRRGVPLMVILIPDEFQVNETVLSDALADAGWSRSDIDLDKPQRRLQTFFSERSVPCLDLLPAFRETPYTYAAFDTHWNITGNHLAAREIAAWLAKNGAD